MRYDCKREDKQIKVGLGKMAVTGRWAFGDLLLGDRVSADTV